MSTGDGERALLERKMRKALQVLILQRGRNPGVKGWEMKRYLGKDYKTILQAVSYTHLDVYKRQTSRRS